MLGPVVNAIFNFSRSIWSKHRHLYKYEAPSTHALLQPHAHFTTRYTCDKSDRKLLSVEHREMAVPVSVGLSSLVSDSVFVRLFVCLLLCTDLDRSECSHVCFFVL